MYIRRLKKIFLITTVVVICALISLWCTKLLVRHWFKTQYQAQVSQAAGKMLIAWYRGIGEEETIERLKIASKNLGWETKVVTMRPRFYIRWFLEKDPIAIAIENFKPNFVLAIQDCVKYYPGVPNYMTLTLGDAKFIEQDERGYVLKDRRLSKFDMLLPAFKKINNLAEAYKRERGNYTGFYWYPTAQKTSYKFGGAKRLFYSGGYLWDTTRSSETYKKFFQLLNKHEYLEVCGSKKKWQHIANATRGLIPIDGVSLLQAQHEAGISLLLHSQLHIDGGAPTGRIFEAAAANTIIISDYHPFIEENFGDNVLYVDTHQTAEDIYAQINMHMQWIFQHPQQARKMAESCHQIFIDKFTLEAQLSKLINVHRAG